MNEEIKDVVKTTKGWKFIVLQEILIFGVLFIIACLIKPALSSLSSFAMVVVGAGASYMGANAIKGLKK